MTDRYVTAIMAAAVGMLAACGTPSSAASNSVPTTTAPVIRTDIVARQQLPGTLTYAGTYSIVNQAGPGVFTRLPAPGVVVSRGQEVYRVNGRPVPLLDGDPAWRRLVVGVADGRDVGTLEDNLVALGFGSSSLRVDNHFDWATAAALRRWQAALGALQTGAFEVGDAVWAPGPIRVTTVHATAGMAAQPGQLVLEATSPQHAVLLPVDVGRQSLIKVGNQVAVTMPDGSVVSGTVSTVGAVAVAQGGNGGGPNSEPVNSTITVTITLADAAAGGSLDQAPVLVAIVYASHKAVLAVPVTALLAEPGGTYAVDVVASGQRRRVPVTTGLFDDRGLVEVSGAGISEGMLVEVPQS
ncbi:MAG TPA: peptidoglycan-binding domain-containing protein [Candidatus Dormibacteraeota bacterium]|nr:peptidoglycan-binding domain-containing protein [Candidatus Dormibacteraeota bacterium]